MDCPNNRSGWETQGHRTACARLYATPSRKLISHNFRPLKTHNDDVVHRRLGIVLLSQVLEAEPFAIRDYPLPKTNAFSSNDNS